MAEKTWPAGPFETEAEALAVWRRERTQDDLGLALQERMALAIERTGIPVGAYDRRIVAWAGRMLDQSTVEVLASLIERAYEAGLTDGAR